LQVIFCTGIAYFLQMLAQKYTKSTHTAIILSLGVVFGSGESKESSSEAIKI
jgi:drug/metabolite transporter (DMT)-like permease